MAWMSLFLRTGKRAVSLLVGQRHLASRQAMATADAAHPPLQVAAEYISVPCTVVKEASFIVDDDLRTECMDAWFTSARSTVGIPVVHDEVCLSWPLSTAN